jgi:hypothetical protein
MYSDWKNRGYVELLKSFFPEQTKTVPRIIVWSFIFLIDLILVVYGAYSLGIFFAGKWVAAAIILCTVFIFWLQGYLWGIFMKLFR